MTLDKHVKKLMRFLGIITPHTKYAWDVDPKELQSKPSQENPGKEKSQHEKEQDLKNHFHPLKGGRLFILDRNEERVLKYKWDGKTESQSQKSLMDISDVVNFYNDWRAGILKPFFKSMPLDNAKDGDDSQLKTLVGENFDQAVFQNSKDYVIFFHSVYCLECPPILAELEKISQEFARFPDIIFAKVDCFHNEGEFIPEGIAGEPVLKIFKAAEQRGDGVTFDGVFVAKELRKFISSTLELAIEDL